MAGKGSKPRNCFSTDYRNNYDSINWGTKTVKHKSVNYKPNENIIDKQENPGSK